MLRGTVWPPALADSLSELRVRGSGQTPEILCMFAPDAAQVDQENDGRLYDLSANIWQTMSIHSAATELMSSQAWDLTAIYYADIDHLSH